jgi:hypothetical protein
VSIEQAPYIDIPKSKQHGVPNTALNETSLETTDFDFGYNITYSFNYTIAISNFDISKLDLTPVMFATLLGTDTGLDPTHRAFPQAQPAINIPGVTDTTSEEDSHGTSVLSVSVGAEYLPGVYGIAKGAPFYFGDMSPPDEEALVFHSCYFDCYFGARSIQTHAMSWGLDGQFGKYGLVCVMFDEDAYQRQTTVYIASAGNEGNSIKTSCPGAAKNVLPVGALNPDGSLAVFSSNATMADGRQSALVYGPGVAILTARGAAYPPGVPGGHSNTRVKHGSSFSNQFLVGIALYEQDQRYVETGEWPHASLIYAILFCHYREIQAWMIFVSDMKGDLANGQALVPAEDNTADICFRARGASRLVLWWLDPPGNENSVNPLLNNLDMIVVSELGMVQVEENDFNVYEFVEMNNHGGDLDVLYRVTVYAKDNFTVADDGEEFGPARFSLYLDATTSVTIVACGSECSIGETRSCGPGGSIQQCLTNGTWNTCSNCTLGYSYSSGSCACDPALAVRNTTTGVLHTPCSVSPASSPVRRSPSAELPNIIGSSAMLRDTQLQNTLILVLSSLLFLF